LASNGIAPRSIRTNGRKRLGGKGMAEQQKGHPGPGDRIMVIVAHPDDAEFMCAGAIAKWTAEGREAVYVLVTSGDKGSPDPTIAPADLAVIREREQCNVCDILGVKAVEFLRYPDGMVLNTLELRKDIVRVIRRHKPSAVITQNPTARWSGQYVNHPDHRNTGDATMDAVFPSARDVHMFPELVADEGLGPHIVEHLYLGDRSDQADAFVDISGSIDTKIRALQAHESQVRNPEETGKFIKRGAAELGASRSMGYAESFKYFYLGQDRSVMDGAPAIAAL
jgi:LmbE family N-acetylglucosaminyl deacetylase